MTPLQPSIGPNYITPSQRTNIPPPSPPAVRKPIITFNPAHLAPFSPSPSTDIGTEDFVVLRRKKGTKIEHEEHELLEHKPKTKKGAMKVKGTNGAGGRKKGEKGNKEKWVRFLDVGISCPSDESDELAFAKLTWTNKKLSTN